jgi:hypothetical protein
MLGLDNQLNTWNGKNLLHHYYDPFPTVEHYELIIEIENEHKNKS